MSGPLGGDFFGLTLYISICVVISDVTISISTLCQKTCHSTFISVYTDDVIDSSQLSMVSFNLCFVDAVGYADFVIYRFSSFDVSANG